MAAYLLDFRLPYFLVLYRERVECQCSVVPIIILFLFASLKKSPGEKNSQMTAQLDVDANSFGIIQGSRTHKRKRPQVTTGQPFLRTPQSR